MQSPLLDTRIRFCDGPVKPPSSKVAVVPCRDELASERASKLAELRRLMERAGARLGAVEQGLDDHQDRQMASRVTADSGAGTCSFPSPGHGDDWGGDAGGDALACLKSIRAGVHEIMPQAYGDGPAAVGFVLALLALNLSSGRAGGQILWCQSLCGRRDFGAVYGHGLRASGVNPVDVIFADARRDIDVLWALEEGARCGALAGLIGDVRQVTFTHTRRLALASEVSGTPVFLLRRHDTSTASAAATRWRVAAMPSAADPYDLSAPGAARWHVELTKWRRREGEKQVGAGQIKTIAGQTWVLEWCDETVGFRVVAGSGARPPAAHSQTMAAPATEARAAKLPAFG